MATDEEYKASQRALQKSRDANKALISQAVDAASNQQVISNLEKAVVTLTDKFGEYEDLSEVSELLKESNATTRSNADQIKELESAIADADESVMDDKSDEIMKLVKSGKVADAITLVKGPAESAAPNATVDELVAVAMAKRGVVDTGESTVPSDDFDSDDLAEWIKMPMLERVKSLDKVKAAMLRG